MAECECLASCPFFNDQMGGMPTTAEMFKTFYCRGDSSQCARYMVFEAMGRDRVPGGLFPNQVEIARKILSAV